MVGAEPADVAGSLPGAACRFSRARIRQGPVRPGSRRRGRPRRKNAGPGHYGICMALAVHPQPAHPPGGGGTGRLSARSDDHRSAVVPGRSAAPRHAKRNGDRHRSDAADRADRRHGLRRRDEESRVHRAELPVAGKRRHADALLGKCRAARRHGNILRPVGHRQDHPVRRPGTHTDRRRRAWLGAARHLQFRGRLLCQDDKALRRGGARDLRHHQAVRNDSRERAARRPAQARFQR